MRQAFWKAVTCINNKKNVKYKLLQLVPNTSLQAFRKNELYKYDLTIIILYDSRLSYTYVFIMVSLQIRQDNSGYTRALSLVQRLYAHF